MIDRRRVAGVQVGQCRGASPHHRAEQRHVAHVFHDLKRNGESAGIEDGVVQLLLHVKRIIRQADVLECRFCEKRTPEVFTDWMGMKCKCR